MVDLGTPWPPRSVVEALGTGEISAELAVILVTHSQTVHEDRTAYTPEERLVWVIHSFLAQISSRVDLVPGLERVTMVGIDPGGRVLLMHSLFSVRVNVYSTQRRIFACLGELPVEGISPVVDIPDEAFAARKSVCAVPRVDHVTRLGGISPLDWQTKPCKRAGN